MMSWRRIDTISRDSSVTTGWSLLPACTVKVRELKAQGQGALEIAKAAHRSIG
jgi:hypothetical protein